MRKLLIGILFFGTLGVKAQYGSLNAILDRLEARKGINQNLEKVNIDNKKFVFIKDEADHTERDFIVIKGNSATYVEVFDDKATGESSSNVFTGDIIRKRTSFPYGQMYLKVKKSLCLLPKHYCLPNRTISSILLMSIPETGGLMKHLTQKRQNKYLGESFSG